MSKWEATVQTPSNHPVSSSVCNHGCLVRIHPLELENKMLRITQRTTTIGREPDNDVFCDDTSISRQHASITKDVDGFLVEDKGSTNGTFVNGTMIKARRLADGDKIQVGNHIFKFLAGDSIESQYHETVYSMMTIDGLTNVYNKRYLVDALSREFERSQAFGRPFSIVMMDIDFFKKFNDNYGHLAGDEVLQEFARRVESLSGVNHIFARFGGEEFAWLMVETECGPAHEYAEAARKLVEEKPFKCCAGDLSVTASFGVAEFESEKHKNFSELLEQADQRLYVAKESGRNQVCSEDAASK
ncbi:MAG: GGDEF domain-containing protein [Planctomycetota bacterium]